MIIKPTDADLTAWSKRMPSGGDIIFFGQNSASIAKSLSVPLFTTEQVKAQSLELWNLDDRSWYGYALNKVNMSSYLPLGGIESFGEEIIQTLGALQLELGIPSVIKASLLPREINKRAIPVADHCWITSAFFRSLKTSARLAIMRAWLAQNEIQFYSSIAEVDMPAGARRLLRSTGLHKYLNKYQNHSGPNCLAATSAAIAVNPLLSNQWLHWPPLKQFLANLNYKAFRSNSPQAGDVLIFRKNKSVVHSAFYLGDNLYFEKSGQDFYEPYRLVWFNDSSQEWPGAKISIFRKSGL